MAATSLRFRTWPITAVRSIEAELRGMGMKIPASKIDGTSSGAHGTNHDSPLSNALVSVGAAGRGGTGSFVSEEGLVLTNWHVAYDAVRRASLRDGKDYVHKGYVSRNRAEDLPGPDGYEVWITESCVDVSDEVVAVSRDEPDPLRRANRVRDVRQEIARKAQSVLSKRNNHDNNNNSDNDKEGGKWRCDVQEMLPNESYILFTYRRLTDVRIVYVPPMSLGNFGGDVDNFEWPRHTADFALLRAYDNDCNNHADNVPYKPRARLRVQPRGANEGDFVFLLGFPGHTMRYAPSPRLAYAQDVDVPHTVHDFTTKWNLIASFEKSSSSSDEAVLKLGNSKKGLANELKRSKGKLVMMQKLGLIEERRAEEEELCRTFHEKSLSLSSSSSSSRRRPPEEVLARLTEIYDAFRADHGMSTALQACRGVYAGSALLAVGHSLHEFVTVERTKPDDQRESTYRERNLPFLCQRLAKRLSDIYDPHETELILDAVRTLSATTKKGLDDDDGLADKVTNILGIDHTHGNDNEDEKRAKIRSLVSSSKLREMDDAFLRKLMLNNPTTNTTEETDSPEDWIPNDPFVQCASALWSAYETERDKSKALLSERDSLLAEMLDLRRFTNDQEDSTTKEVIYPDCNGSLRLSAGYVEGYRAADAVEHRPRTTLQGLYDKAIEARLTASGGGDTYNNGKDKIDVNVNDNVYECPSRLYEMLSSANTEEKPVTPNVMDVPVCLLYSTDTVGGNSGSPVMNSGGELVGINFDRQRNGLMNEYKWSKEYSRSIGVDIRYVLWLVGDYDGATYLVDEMLS